MFFKPSSELPLIKLGKLFDSLLNFNDSGHGRTYRWEVPFDECEFSIGLTTLAEGQGKWMALRGLLAAAREAERWRTMSLLPSRQAAKNSFQRGGLVFFATAKFPPSEEEQQCQENGREVMQTGGGLPEEGKNIKRLDREQGSKSKAYHDEMRRKCYEVRTDTPSIARR